MIGIDLFSGAGGMSLGAAKANIDVKLAIEKNVYAAQSYAYNHVNTTVVIDDIVNINELNFSNKKGEQVILFGGPPCQGFSKSNQRNRSINDPRNYLFKTFIKWADKLMPDWILIENVPNLKGMEDSFFLREIISELNKIGYTVNFQVLDSSRFNVPQKRERIFIVGSLEGIGFEFPEGLENSINVKDALNDLPNLVNGNRKDTLPYSRRKPSQYALTLRNNNNLVSNNRVTKNADYIIERYKYIKQGDNWKSIPDSLMKNYTDKSRCHGSIYRRLKSKEKSMVITNFRKNMLIHPIQNRGLSVREAARIQSFPDNFKFIGPLFEQQQQVGNSVPPNLAMSIFKKINQLAS